ncbi:hypothetical protein AAVH_17896 [Aphelenchoides avenae]|nr:hypothetical protein AAVH_17896 [Aphelenchus avenae]
MASGMSELIGLEELQPEPCDGTGDDAMSTRFRKKWLKGDRVRSQRNADLQALDYAAFGAWFMGQRRYDPEVRRLCCGGYEPPLKLLEWAH